jgi:hypothetical protein
MHCFRSRVDASQRRHICHEHEFEVWRAVELPPGRPDSAMLSAPPPDGIEHPDLIADIITFAQIVGRETSSPARTAAAPSRSSANTWAKLRHGAAVASKKL